MPNKILSTCLRWYIYILTALLPFKFSAFINGGEQANFPMSLLEWLIYTSWPPFLLPALCALPLIAAVLLYKPPHVDIRLLLPLTLIVTFGAGLAGLFKTTELDFATNWLWFYSGVSCYALSVFWASDKDEHLLSGMLNTIAATTLLCTLHGWRQHFGGLEATLQAMIDNAKETGIPLTQHFIDKMRQTRIYGTFIDPNVYAGHLILTCPAMLIALYRWGAKFEPRKLSQTLFVGLGAVLFAGALFWSGSRGAVVGLAAGIGAAVWLCPIPKKLRIGLGIIGILCVILLVLALNIASKRDMLTASVRMEYYRTSTAMFCQSPLSGEGLGMFFPWHMRLKPMVSEEARDPHSMFFALVGQCGLAGLLAALFRISLPFLIVLGLGHQSLRKDRPLVIASLAGWCAWMLHSQLQFNDLIPSSCMISAVIGLMAFRTGETSSTAKQFWPLRLVLAAGGLCCFWALHVLAGEITLQRYDTLMRQAQSNSLLSSPRTMETLLNKACRQLPLSPVPVRLLGEFYERLAMLPEASKAYQELVRRTPSRSSSYTRLASCQIQQGQYDEALSNLATAEEWYPANHQMFYLKALALLGQEGRMPFSSLAPWLMQPQMISRSDETHLFIDITKTPATERTFTSAILDLLNSVGLSCGTYTVQFRLMEILEE